MIPSEASALSISEELLLLSLDDDQGKLVTSDSTVLRFTLAGAVLYEFLLLQVLEIREGTVVSWPTERVGDPILDMAIKRFKHINKVKKLSFWLPYLAKDFFRVRAILLDKLVGLGALKKEEHEFLWVFHYHRYPTDDGRIEDAIRRRLRESLYGQGSPSRRDAVLLSLVSAGKLEIDVFGEADAAEARQRIAALKKQFGLGQAITQAILDFEFSM